MCSHCVFGQINAAEEEEEEERNETGLRLYSCPLLFFVHFSA